MSSIKFGTDGWRAVIAKDFTFDNLKILSQAVADYLRKMVSRQPLVVVGYDSRFLSKEFAETVALVFAANNIKVILSHMMVSTPVVSFAAKNMNCDLGIMITASHNPGSFNGFKIKTPQGGAASIEITNEVEELLFKSEVKFLSLAQASSEGLLTIFDLSIDYIKFIRKYLDFSLVKKLKLKVLVDIMHGSSGSYIERVLKGSKIQFSYLRKDFNPWFGGMNPEPVEKNLQELIKAMKSGKYDLGVALDGDGDRIACVLKGGRYVDAQALLPLLALHMAKNRRLSGVIVKTLVGSRLVDLVALYLGRILFETAVGFKHISDLFHSEDVLIGGEEAGGIGVKNYIPERDGTMAAVLLLEMCAFLRSTPGKLIKEMDRKFGRWYYRRISMPVGMLNKGALSKIKVPSRLLGKTIQRINIIDGFKMITDDSWLMFRASGTEPIVRIYAEAKTGREAERLLDLGKKLVNAL